MAYYEILPKINKKQSLVYGALKLLGSATNQQISNFLKIPINCVTPRILELRKYGFVEEDRIVINQNNRSSISWRIR